MFLFAFAENFIDNGRNKNNYAYNNKYRNHTRNHIFKIVDKSHRIKIAEYAFRKNQIIKHNTNTSYYIKKLRIRPPAITDAI